MTKEQLIDRFMELSREEAAIMDEMNNIRKMILQVDMEILKAEEPEEEIPEMVTIKQASERTGISYSAIRDMCKRNEIVHIMAGSKYLVNMGKLNKYLNGKAART